MRIAIRAVALAITMVGSGLAFGHGSAGKGDVPFDPATVEQTRFGRAGDPGKATRTMRIGMSDAMRFSPARLTVKKGETVRFIVRNDGKVLHEMVLGTDAELAKHADLMRRFPTMKHDEPHMVHVEPGQTGSFAWTFNRAGEFRFACLIPGHFQAGMVGTVIVE
jgi:uncharacterized cupredoxin-like copper-binding protein